MEERVGEGKEGKESREGEEEVGREGGGRKGEGTELRRVWECKTEPLYLM